jgi:hypothetical protein
MSTVTATTTVKLQSHLPRLAIDHKRYEGLDPEWTNLWMTHGADMVRADEVSIEEYRKNPALYSFTYPTCAGSCYLCQKMAHWNADIFIQAPMFSM